MAALAVIGAGALVLPPLLTSGQLTGGGVDATSQSEEAAGSAAEQESGTLAGPEAEGPAESLADGSARALGLEAELPGIPENLRRTAEALAAQEGGTARNDACGRRLADDTGGRVLAWRVLPTADGGGALVLLEAPASPDGSGATGNLDEDLDGNLEQTRSVWLLPSCDAGLSAATAREYLAP
jgi:hypothetical protein